MLTLTENARTIVSRIAKNPKTSDTAGVRISRNGAETNALGVALAERAHPDDEVVECDGGRVYLGKFAVPAMRGKTLDCRTGDDGRVHFGIAVPAP